MQALRGSERFGRQVAAYRFMAGRPAAFAPMPAELHPGVKAVLTRLGFDRLYSHQAAALSAVLAGRHTVVATPTASGKTLIYNVPLLDAVARDPHARALYIFPLKALAQDQFNTLVHWAGQVDDPSRAPGAAIYDGDTNDYQRRKIRRAPPSVVITNPEMVHLALLPHHDLWAPFFRHLQLVVIDEVHTYRGMLGAHMAQVVRRLRRVCDHYGAAPVFVCASATVADPGRLAEQLIGLPVTTINESGAPQGGRHLALIDPEESPSRAAIQLLKAALSRRLRTIVYTQSRKMAELIALWVQEGRDPQAAKVNVYRAGLLPEARRRIEARLKSGDLLAVVSTSALELGIDIGDLDLCILVGYPGSMTATWQRSGRVGRQGQPAGLIMIAGQDALDHYFIATPEAFFQGRAEAAVVNPINRTALAAHLVCAAAELPLAVDEPWIGLPAVAAVVAELASTGELRTTADGLQWHAARRRPHLKVHLRGSGLRHRIVDPASNSTIGEIDDLRLYREAHPGAIYLHEGVTYRVETVDPPHQVVYASEMQVDYYTRVLARSDVDVVQEEARHDLATCRVCIGRLRVTDQVTGYETVRSANGRPMQRIPLDAPAHVFDTEGIWFEVPAAALRAVTAAGSDTMGALHAAEHAAIAIMPLLVLADRNDLGGLSTNYHPHTGSAAIFIYDGIPGGAGFSREAFVRAVDLLHRALQVIERCNCDNGCPACVHSPKCGSGNQPIDKHGARLLLEALAPPPATAPPPMPATPPAPTVVTCSRRNPQQHHYGVFDLETQRSAEDVGGWHMARKMKMSCGVVYDSRADDYFVYLEKDMAALVEHLSRLERVVGFNIVRFDYQVLAGYTLFDFERLQTVDLLTLVRQTLGHRLSLDHLARATLGATKSADGLDALRWWREGRMDQIIDYCREDVRITRDLYRYALEKGHLIYSDRQGIRFRVPLAL
ncbi:DEAD/DEAH box helicase [Desulfatitalea alkaliphila]|uniref:DEAD/DEAH box helicase n=1 Tax=Desulfatitalea alkaliphila TaxID=2929485 RepID=A0AA41R300_9BACT|nr:DEAD/DEAH box helicase [Desulfatitalea alkaliphila]MCJ8501264.1 DEAD/DEAH box helicase [Desulfatitalea alkaliphila]